jgi:hypothetical protein
MKKALLAGLVLGLGCAIGGSVNAQAGSGTLSQAMMQCLQRENANWYHKGVSNTHALDDCYVIGTEETAKAIALLGQLRDNGSGTPAPSPWIQDHCAPRAGGYVYAAHGINIWFRNQGPQQGIP